jgi:hypothetical protein
MQTAYLSTVPGSVGDKQEPSESSGFRRSLIHYVSTNVTLLFLIWKKLHNKDRNAMYMKRLPGNHVRRRYRDQF